MLKKKKGLVLPYIIVKDKVGVGPLPSPPIPTALYPLFPFALSPPLLPPIASPFCQISLELVPF